MTIKFTKDHEWVKLEGEFAFFGITDFAAEQLGDIVFVELPEIGAGFKAGDAIAVVESVKAASDVYAPLSCEIIDTNQTLVETPELVNSSAQNDAWFAKIKISNLDELEGLMDISTYKEFIENQ